MKTLLPPCLTALLLSLGGSASAAERLAVLELTGEGPTEQRGLLTDVVRGAVVTSLGTDIHVMTRENMEVMLGDMGIDASCVSEGACEVETARNLGVDYVVSGGITQMGPKLVASLKLHATESGALLSSKQVTADDMGGLLDGLADPAEELVASLSTASGWESGGVTARPAVVSPQPPEVAAFDPSQATYTTVDPSACRLPDLSSAELRGGKIHAGSEIVKLNPYKNAEAFMREAAACGHYGVAAAVQELAETRPLMTISVVGIVAGVGLLFIPMTMADQAKARKKIRANLEGSGDEWISTIPWRWVTDDPDDLSLSSSWDKGIWRRETFSIRNGDVLLEVGGVPVENFDQVVQVVKAMPPFATTTLLVQRGGQELELSGQLGGYPDDESLYHRLW